MIPSLPYTGSYALDEIQSLFHSTTQPFLRPDGFDEKRRWHRLVEIEGKQVALQLDPSGTLRWSSPEYIEPMHIQHQLNHLLLRQPLPNAAIAHLPEELAARFLHYTPLIHIASTSLGEALIKAIIRQVISATQAKKLLHRFVMEYGPSVKYNETTSYGFPSLETIAQISPESLVACGFGYKARIIPRIARDLLETRLEEKIQGLAAETAVDLLQQLKGVGRWTARVTVCDLRGEWSVYPFEDLAVRTWASRLWPEHAWPREEQAFLRTWQEMNGPYTGIITCYLLAQANLVPQEKRLEQPTLL